MLSKLIRLSIDNRLFVVIVGLLIAVLGTITATRMPVDVLPDLNRPTVTVMSEAHAMEPLDVERLVTIPLEQTLNGATGVTRVRSSSGLGLSVVTVEFEWGTDIYRNRQIVSEKLQLTRSRLPDHVQPQMAPISSIMGQVQIIGVQWADRNRPVSELRALVDYELRNRLSSITGVAKVITMGGAAKQLQVIMDAGKLRTFGVTPEDVAAAIRDSNRNAGGGFINLGAAAPVITVRGLLTDEEELANAVVRADADRPILISDIGRVEFGPALVRTGDASVNGAPGVVLVIMKQPGSDTVKLTEAVDSSLAEWAAGMGGAVTVEPALFRQADFIHRAIDNVFDAVKDGSILVVIVLFIFLMNVRTTFITLTAIPLSVAVTALAFHTFGLSINTMTLGGLAVAVGALVDDAIVGVENVFRRLSQNADAAEGDRLSATQVVYTACREVQRPIVIGTALVIVVYLPLFFLSGLEGRLFTPIGIAYIVSVTASLLVALTVTPALCCYLLPKYVAAKERSDSLVVRGLKSVADRCIRFSIRRAPHVVAVLAVLTTLAVAVAATRGTQFLPEFNEGVAQINMFLPPETGLETSTGYAQYMSELMLDVDGVASVVARTGRAAGDEHAEGVNVTEAIVTFSSDTTRSRAAMIAEIRDRMHTAFPGVAIGVDQPLAHLLSHMLSGVKAQVAIKAFGPNLDELRRISSEVEAAIREIDGVKDLIVEPQVLVPNVEVTPHREQMRRFGITVDQIAETVELSLGGEPVSRMIDGQFAYPIVVRLNAADRENLDKVRNILIMTENGDQLRLRDVADVHIAATPNNVNREHVSRRIVVQHNVADRSLGEVVADVQAALVPIRQQLAESGRSEYSLVVSGQFEAQQAATRRIGLLSVMSLLMMVLILFMHFKSLNLSMQVLAGIPMAFIGAVAYILLSDQALSVATLVGLVSLAGIAARNGILLIDHYLRMIRVEGAAFSEETLVRAGQERMVPVVMTALTSGIALVPLALAPGEPGREILYPVATVIIGGLISSTLLEFSVRPALFWLFGRDVAAQESDAVT
jgi:CzcA family heavy metal efflux pump